MMASIALALRYWREAVMGALLIALGLMWLNLTAEKRHAGKLQSALSDCEAMRKVQNAAVAAMRVESERKQAEAAKALEQARRQSERVEVTARELERERPLSGGCQTPEGIMGAGL